MTIELRTDQLVTATGGAMAPTSSAWLTSRGAGFSNDRGKWGLPRTLADPSAASWHTAKQPGTYSRLWTGAAGRADVKPG